MDFGYGVSTRYGVGGTTDAASAAAAAGVSSTWGPGAATDTKYKNLDKDPNVVRERIEHRRLEYEEELRKKEEHRKKMQAYKMESFRIMQEK